MDKLAHMLKSGGGWVRFHEGRLEVKERLEEIPRPARGPRMTRLTNFELLDILANHPLPGVRAMADELLERRGRELES